MVTLHILKLLENNNFGTIDESLFFEKLTLDKKGLYIYSRGNPLTRGARFTQAFDIYARGYNDVDGYKKLEDVLYFLLDCYKTVCDLPEVPPISNVQYKNVTLQPTSNVTNVEFDPNNRVIYMISGQASYTRIKEN